MPYFHLVLESGRRWILFKYCSSLGGECLLVDEAEFDQFHFHKIWRPTHLLSLFHWLLRMCSIAWDWTEREISLFFRNNKIQRTFNLKAFCTFASSSTSYFFFVLTQLKVFYHVHTIQSVIQYHVIVSVFLINNLFEPFLFHNIKLIQCLLVFRKLVNTSNEAFTIFFHWNLEYLKPWWI